MAESKVAVIVGSLSKLEDDLDSLGTRLEEMKKSLNGKAQAEIDELTAKTRQMATVEAEAIIGEAKAKAEAESARIAKEGEARLQETQSRIDSGFEQAVSHVVSTVLKV